MAADRVVQPDVPVARERLNRTAVVSVVAGVVWLYGLGSVLAVITGVIALRQARERGERGRGLAWTGIMLGVVGLALILMLLPA